MVKGILIATMSIVSFVLMGFSPVIDEVSLSSNVNHYNHQDEEYSGS